MITNVEFIVVGAGLTGAVIARALHDAGHRVLMLDRRSHIAGNVHDHAHASGIRVHTYGPHHFRTNDEDLWAYVNRFAQFFTYEPAPKALVDGRHENWPIDEFFGFDMGRLAYRGQQRDHEYRPDIDWLQPGHQVNNPDPANGPHVRTIEWKHMMEPDYARQISGTVLTREIPFTPNDPGDYEYPFPDSANRRLYDRYRERARTLGDVLICGRLGEYRYYDMDHAIARARLLARRLLQPGPPAPRS